jgi:hypothetical protein
MVVMEEPKEAHMAMKTNNFIALLLAFMVNAVIYGSLVTAVLSIEALSPWWEYWLPIVIGLSLISTPFVAKWLAPKLRVNN